MEAVILGKGLDELAPADAPARLELVRYLRRLLPAKRVEREGSDGSGGVGNAAGGGGSTRSSAKSEGAGNRVDSGSKPSASRAVLRCDGASRGNPGPAAVGVVLEDGDGEVISSFGRRIGSTTNNVAEYQAVLAGLEEAQARGIVDLEMRLDSELVVRQITGQYKVKHPQLVVLKHDVDLLLRGFRTFRVKHVPRAENHAADKLANEALDAVSS